MGCGESGVRNKISQKNGAKKSNAHIIICKLKGLFSTCLNPHPILRKPGSIHRQSGLADASVNSVVPPIICTIRGLAET